MNDSSNLRPLNLAERLTKAEYEKETLATLKYRLGFRGLIRQGNKQEIVHRLVKDDEKTYTRSRKASYTVSTDSPSPQEQMGIRQKHASAGAPPNEPGNLEPRASAMSAPPAIQLKPMEQYKANIPTSAEERKDNHRVCAKVHQDLLNMLQVCYKMDDDIKEAMRTEEAEAVLLEAIRILETVLRDSNAFFLAGLLVADTLACLQWLNKYWAGAVRIMVEKEKELRARSEKEKQDRVNAEGEVYDGETHEGKEAERNKGDNNEDEESKESDEEDTEDDKGEGEEQKEGDAENDEEANEGE